MTGYFGLTKTISSFLTILSVATAGDPVDLDVTRGTQLVIQCKTAQLKLIGQASAKLKVSYSSSDVTIKKETLEDVFRINCEKEDPKLVIQIQGQPVSIKSNLRSGSINVQSWAAPAHLVVEKGSVVTDKTSGLLNVNVINGQIEIQNHEGKIKVDTFNSKLTLANVQGSVDATNFSGTTSIKGVTGEVSLNSRQGSSAVETVNGGFKFLHDNGKLDVTGVSGALEGESDQAAVNIKLMNPARLKAKIKNGNYKVSVPSSSGAQVSLSFNEAQYLVPSFLKQDSYGTNKIVRGNLRGGEMGKISLTGDNARVQISTF